MDDEADLNNSPAGAEPDAPMHYLFEIQLMTNEIVGEAPAEGRANYAWMVKTQHVRRYLVHYYRDHAMLPMDRRYLGMTRPLNLEMGMVDLGAIRQKIRADSAKRLGMNSESPGSFEDFPDHPLRAEIKPGIPKQAAGREPNQVVFDLRKALTKRGDKG